MPQMLRDQAFRRMVPVVGLEPTRCRHRRILNPLRLPFHHTGTFYRETPKILIGENKERTHYKSHILLYLGSLEKSRFLSDFILPDLLAFESATSTNSITPACSFSIRSIATKYTTPFPAWQAFFCRKFRNK